MAVHAPRRGSSIHWWHRPPASAPLLHAATLKSAQSHQRQALEGRLDLARGGRRLDPQHSVVVDGLLRRGPPLGVGQSGRHLLARTQLQQLRQVLCGTG